VRVIRNNVALSVTGGKDIYAQSADVIKYAALACLTSCGIVTAQSLRIIRKTFMKCKEKDRTLRFQLAKSPVRVTLYNIASYTPTAIVSCSKIASPETVLFDPGVNPVFFTFAFMIFNSEWWAFSIIALSILDPIITGIHKKLIEARSL